jgi:hypothetical protein
MREAPARAHACVGLCVRVGAHVRAHARAHAHARARARRASRLVGAHVTVCGVHGALLELLLPPWQFRHGRERYLAAAAVAARLVSDS